MKLSAEKLVEQGFLADVTVDEKSAHEYALATGEEWIAAFEAGIVPPVFGFVVASTPVATVIAGALGEALLGMLHVRQEMQFHSPLVIGETISVDARINGAGPAALGSVISVEAVLTSSTGEPRMSETLTLLLNGTEIEGKAGIKPRLRGTMPPGDREPESVKEIHIPTDLPIRYAEASGDRMPVHLDDEVAKSLGFPGVILHGMCTLATSIGAVVAATGLPGDQLRSLTARFGEPVIPGKSVFVRTWLAGGGEAAFEVANDSGGLVLRFGTASIGALEPAS